MRSARFVQLATVFLVATACACGQCDITFSDAGPETMTLGNSHFSLRLSKNNGSILGVTDHAVGSSLTLGSRGGYLWGALFRGPRAFIGAGDYGPSSPNRFTYTWNPPAELVLSYAGNPSAPHVDATAKLTASCGSYVDMRMEIRNNWGNEMIEVRLPSELSFSVAAVSGAHVPSFLPGVFLKPGFFLQNRTWAPVYPSKEATADYISLSGSGTHLAVYTVNPGGPVRPVILGFVDDDRDPSRFYTLHNFYSATSNGGTDATPVVRMRVGDAPDATILDYRHDNAIDLYPSLRQKLGSDFDRLVRSPLLKADAVHIGKPFAGYGPALANMTSPQLLHLAAYMPGGHDHSYPDVLPPDSRWGATSDLENMVSRAHALGFLFMPYLNISWWTLDSPTIIRLPNQSPPPTLADIAVLDERGQPLIESYNGNPGVVVSPCQAWVRQRLDRAMTEWRTVAPADYVFLDQIGSRTPPRDYNPGSPNRLAYADCWLRFVKDHAGFKLHTEDGWDRLGADLIAFHGSVLGVAPAVDNAYQSWKAAEAVFGPGNVEPYPLATWLLHDKALFYQHDLSPQTMTHGPGVLTWNIAFGFMLSYIWPGATDAVPDPAWVDLVLWTQRLVASRYAGERLTGFRKLDSDVTESTFGPISIVANWSASAGYQVENLTIAPGGYMAFTRNARIGRFIAGAFAGAFNNHALSPGTHYLFIDRNTFQTTVRQAFGADTLLAIAPPQWRGARLQATALRVRAVDQNGTTIGDVPSSVQEGLVVFTYAVTVNGHRVAYYSAAYR